jgi:cbb3-type cytochrome oxidase subunit 3
LLICLFCSNYCFAQYPVVTASIDRTEILIGEQFKLSVEAKVANDDYKLSWPVLPDSFQHFEIVDKSKIDSVYAEGKLSSIKQIFTVTSFDSGKWLVPSLKINITPVAKAAPMVLYTDSLPITVSFSVSDTTNQLRDIKPIRQVNPENLIWYWIAGAVLLLILIGLIIWYFNKKKKKPADIFKAKLSPYDEAMQELQELKKTNLSGPAEVKLYHTKLTDIFKRYLSRKANQFHLNKTTGDILVWLNDTGLQKTEVSKAAYSLRCSDAVKFAKYQPDRAESNESLQSIKEVIEATEKLTIQPNNN